MKRLGLCAVAFLVISCVSQPVPATQDEQPQAEAVTVAPAAPSGPVRKERLEAYMVPVVIKETVSFADGLVEKVITYTYDEGYKKLLSTVSRKPSAKNPLESTSFDYLGEAVASKSTFGPDGTRISKCEYQYGSKGELVKETVLDGKGIVQSISEWVWDNGRKSTWRVLNGAGLIQARTEYSYEVDRLAGTRLLDGSGSEKGKIEYIYAEGDALAQIKYFTAAGSPDGKIDYVLKDGMVTQENVYRADGRMERRLSFEYGLHGALVKKTLADSAGRTREITMYENAYRTETRTVVYYE
jgi:hypothetical protein